MPISHPLVAALGLQPIAMTARGKGRTGPLKDTETCREGVERSRPSKKSKASADAPPKIDLLDVEDGDFIDENAVSTKEKGSKKRKSTKKSAKGPIKEEDAALEIVPTAPSSLAARLGMRAALDSASDDKLDGTSFVFDLGITNATTGSLDGKIPEIAKRAVESALAVQQKATKALLASDATSNAIDEEYVRLYGKVSGSGSLTGNPPAPPAIVRGLLRRIEADSGEEPFFPAITFATLLDEGLVSDASHPNLARRVAEHGDIGMMLLYMQSVPDMKEASLLHMLSFSLSSLPQEGQYQDEFVPFSGFSHRETLISTLLSWNFNSRYMAASVKALSIVQVVELLTILHKLLVLYRDTHCEELDARQSLTSRRPKGVGRLMKLASRANVLKWIECLLDAHYPATLLNAAAMEVITTINGIIVEESRATEGLLGVKSLLSTMAHMSHKLKSSKKSTPPSLLPQPLVYANYTVELGAI